MRPLRAHVLEHPLVKHRHSSVVSLPFLRWLTLQLPLRGEAIVVFVLSLINFLPLVAFYDLYVGDNNTFYPGPTSKRDQICRHLADRTAILGTAQLPLLILMASQRTPLAIVAGLGMNSLMLYHRWIARWFWLHIVIHASAYTAIYVRRGGVAEMLEETYVKWGVVGLSMMFGLVCLYLRALRQRFYEVGIRPPPPSGPTLLQQDKVSLTAPSKFLDPIPRLGVRDAAHRNGILCRAWNLSTHRPDQVTQGKWTPAL